MVVQESYLFCELFVDMLGYGESKSITSYVLLSSDEYCYARGSSIIHIKNNKQKLKQQLYMATNKDNCHEIVTDKPPNHQECVSAQINTH